MFRSTFRNIITVHTFVNSYHTPAAEGEAAASPDTADTPAVAAVGVPAAVQSDTGCDS